MINECCIFISSQFRRGQHLIGIARLLHLYHNIASVPPFAILPLQNVCRGASTASPSPQFGTSARPLRPRLLLLLLDSLLSLERGSLQGPHRPRFEGQAPADPLTASAAAAAAAEWTDGGRGAFAERPRRPPLSLWLLGLSRDLNILPVCRVLLGGILDPRGMILLGQDPLVPWVRVPLGHGARWVQANAAHHGAELR